jgi:predicted nucleotidyltransferase
MVSRQEIQEFVDRVVRHFRPAAVILFGSHAYGQPTEDSDVDLMIIMPNQRGSGPQVATEIRLACPRAFPMDLIVRTAEEVRDLLKRRDPFLSEVKSKGIVLHESRGARVGR